MTVSFENKVYRAFGVCDFGAFVLDESQQVLLFRSDPVSFEQALVYVNASLEKFVQSFCLFMMAVYRLKGQVDGGSDSLQHQAYRLIQAIRDIEEKAVAAETFWHYLAYLLEDDGVMVFRPFVTYLKDGRLK